jgi:hypothetical protein
MVGAASAAFPGRLRTTPGLAQVAFVDGRIEGIKVPKDGDYKFITF